MTWSSRGRRRWRRGSRSAVGTVLLVGVFHAVAAPAIADPAVPTNYRSTVSDVVDADGQPVDLDVEVLGGDTYLVVDVADGTQLEVPGYDGEPYIRIHADGEVEVNERSPARWLNDARYGSAEVDVPTTADSDAPPDWQVVANEGVYAWHDHRIHFMSPALPQQVDPSLDEVQPIWDWEVPITIDGRAATIVGELVWVPGTGLALPLVGLMVALALAVLAARKIGAEALIVVAAVCTLVLATANNVGLPPGADRMPALWGLSALALVVLAIGRYVTPGEDVRALVLRLLAAVPPSVGAFLLVGALHRPVVPGLLPTLATRGIVMTILALSGASIVVLGQRLWAASSLDLPGADDGATGP